ncbi:MAG: NmrA family NAD(P)-binding protein [Sphingomonadaceae bacterium]|nr:NmrA family NAD(P)-binding protein [Sphingomonadaceae bacterium]
MRVLVIGGTGKIGRHLVHGLRAAGVEATAASRHPEADGIALGMADAHAVEAAAKGFDAAYLTTPLGPDEGEIGTAAVAALRRAGVGKIVYLAIHNLEAMREIPHFETKIPVKQAVLSEASGVVLQPNFFFQNDLMALPAILDAGIYPLPIGTAGVWSIDVADIARAAVNALTGDGWNGRAVPLCGPQKLTGPMIAQNWSSATGRAVIYPGDDVAPFVAAMRAQIPGFTDWMANDFTLMMQITQRDGCPATEEDRAATEAIVGQKLIRHSEFAANALKENRS